MWIDSAVGVVAIVRGGNRLRHVEQASAQLDLAGTVAVGEQAVMANAMKAVRQHVERKRGLIPVLRRLSWTGRYCLVLSRQGSLVCQVICQLMGTASVALGC